MSKPLLTIQIVGWNNEAALRAALPNLKKIPAGEVDIFFIDNNSSDNSVAFVQTLLPTATIIRNSQNKGFGEAHNQAISLCRTPFVLTHNPDLALDWPGTKKLLAAFADAKVGAVQGKLYRDEGHDVFDSTGIVQNLTLTGRERGAGESDHGQYNVATPLWAVTAACGIYRVQALREIAYQDREYFDQDFFAYREDVDLGWRLNKAGWQVCYLPVAAGVHQRSLRTTSRFGWGLNPIKVHARLRDRRTRLSLRNWLWMVIKNATFKEHLTHEIFVDARAAVFLLLSVSYPPLLTVWFEILAGIPRMIAKRSEKE
ncbi:MAG: glycosyltransferase family 2 protein [Candidatus Andersenbacteria bacterium]